jgi:PTS system beta-glucosides-specific IIC component
MLVFTISGVFAPILPGLMAIGIIKGLIAILSVCFPGWSSSEDSSYKIILAAGDTLMYFLPILVAYTAAQKFGLDPILGMVIGGALVYPDIVALYPFGPWEVYPFLGLKILVMMRYSGTVLPSIITVYAASKMYKSLRQSLPSAVKNFLAPFFTLIVMIPLMFLIIGPIFGAVGLGIQNGIKAIIAVKNIGPIILGAITGGFWQVLVIFGLHWAVVPIGIMEASTPNPIWANNGVTVALAYIQIAVLAQVAAVFAMSSKMKNAERKSGAMSTVIGGIFGITEPVIYGFTLPKKKPFFIACINGAIFGAIAGVAGNFISDGHGVAVQMGAMGVFSYPSALLPGFAGSTANFLIVLLASIGAGIGTFIVVRATYQPDAIELKAVEETVIDTSKVNTAAAKKILAPVKGRVMPINQSADAAHQEEALGKGVCIMPLGGKIFAPFDGVVDMIFDTKHAINLTSKDGIQLLIHCGIDTVKLGGEGFTVHVKEDQQVKAGDLLYEYNKDIIAKAGYSLETQVVVTNTDEYKAVTLAKSGDCNVGDLILYIE